MRFMHGVLSSVTFTYIHDYESLAGISSKTFYVVT